MKYISAKHEEPFMLVAFKGDEEGEFVVRTVPLSKAVSVMYAASVEWVVISDDAVTELRQDLYARMLGD